MLPPTNWTCEQNDQRYAELPADIRDQILKHALTLTGDFSADYPKACSILNIEIHPVIHAFIYDYQPVARPIEKVPDPEPIAVSEPLVVPVPNASGGKSQRGGKPDPKDAKAVKGKKSEAANIPVSPQKPPEPVILYDRQADERDMLAMSRCQIDAGTMAAIAMCLPLNRFLTSIRMHQCACPAASFPSLFQSISKSSIQMLSLTAVDLKDDADAFVSSIASLVSNFSSIQYLNVGQNDFTDQHSSVIAQSLKSNSSIIGLDLAGNTVGTLACQAFATSLSSNITLQYLNLSHTSVTSSDISLLFSSMIHRPVDKSAKKEPRVQTSKKGVLYREANSSLRHLDLRFTSIKESDDIIQSVLNNRESIVLTNPDADTGVGMYNKLDRIRCGRT